MQSYCFGVQERINALKRFVETNGQCESKCIKEQIQLGLRIPCIIPTCFYMAANMEKFMEHTFLNHTIVQFGKLPCAVEGCVVKVDHLEQLTNHIATTHGAVLRCKMCCTRFATIDDWRHHVQEYKRDFLKITTDEANNL